MKKKSLVESKEDQPFLMMFLAENILDTKLNCGLTFLAINMFTQKNSIKDQHRLCKDQR